MVVKSRALRLLLTWIKRNAETGENAEEDGEVGWI
jgi:hypothetical protein